jgi:hypothetical protein
LELWHGKTVRDVGAEWDSRVRTPDGVKLSNDNGGEFGQFATLGINWAPT